MAFVKAEKKQLKARIGLIGAAGSGKTYTALLLAKSLGGPIAVIDTERKSASKYAGDVADFDVLEPESFAPSVYLNAIAEAAQAGYPVLVIDSLSHAWEGEGGILDQVDKRGGRFDSWKDMSPQTRSLIDAILKYPGHVIATMRTKTEWVVEEVEDRGRKKSVPRKIGLAPRFKEGLEYELDIVGTLDDDNVLRISKSRCPGLSGQSIAKPGAQLAATILAWLNDGVAVDPRDLFSAEAKTVLGLLGQAQNAAHLEAARAATGRVWKRLTPAEQKAIEAAGLEATERVKAAAPQQEAS